MTEAGCMAVLDQQVPQWFPAAWDPHEGIRELEAKRCECQEARKLEKLEEAAERFVIPFDTPVFGLTPNYPGDIEFDRIRVAWGRHTHGMCSVYPFM